MYKAPHIQYFSRTKLSIASVACCKNIESNSDMVKAETSNRVQSLTMICTTAKENLGWIQLTSKAANDTDAFRRLHLCTRVETHAHTFIQSKHIFAINIKCFPSFISNFVVYADKSLPFFSIIYFGKIQYFPIVNDSFKTHSTPTHKIDVHHKNSNPTHLPHTPTAITSSALHTRESTIVHRAKVTHPSGVLFAVAADKNGESST